MTDRSLPSEALPPDLVRQVDRVCNEFEAAWRSGQRRPVEEFLAGRSGRERQAIARELIPLEVYYRRRAGDECRPEEYGSRFPDLDPDWLSGAVADDTGRDTGDRAATPPATPRTSASRPGPPPAVPGYEILDELGRGGMGVVYQARQVRLGRTVALKMIRSGTGAGPEELARFQAEAESAARLHHPNIVQIYEIGEHDGRPYIALEFVPGGTLARRLADAPAAARPAAESVAVLARAVQYAHERGIVHRDLKPANVLLAADGTPKVTDLGLARRLDADSGQTQSGAVLGTPSYMAPEQASGKSAASGPAADVYALGAILYECLTGRPPFRGATVLDTLELVRTQDPVPPSRLAPKVPRDLETICLKCLRKEPAARYPSDAGDLAADLDRFLGGRPVRARRTSLLGRCWRLARRNRVASALISLVVVLLVGSSVGASLVALWLREERDTAVDRQVEANMAAARLAPRTGRIGQRFEGLTAVEEATEALRRRGKLTPERALELRNLAVVCLATPDLRPGPEYVGEAGPPRILYDGGFDGSLGQYAEFALHGATLAVRRTADRTAVWQVPWPAGNGGPPEYVRFSSDGHFLATVPRPPYAPGRAAFVFDLRTGTGPVTLDGVRAVDWHPDGRTLAAVHSDGTVRLHQLPGGATVRQVTDQTWVTGARRPQGLRFDPTGRYLAVHMGMFLFLADLEHDIVRPLPYFQPGIEVQWRGVEWSHDGRWLGVIGSDGRVYLQEAWGPWRPTVLDDPDGQLVGLHFCPTGGLLVCYSPVHLSVWDAAGGRRWLSAPGTGARFSADGGRLAAVRDDTVNVWEVADGGVSRTLSCGAIRAGSHVAVAGPFDVGFSPDGRLLTAAGDNGVHLFDPAAGARLAYIPLAQTNFAQFDPDDGSLVTNGAVGLYRWRVQAAGEDGPVSVGPFRVIYPRGSTRTWYRVGTDHVGRRVLVADRETRARLLDTREPGPGVQLLDRTTLHGTAVSPDGAWAAAATLGGRTVQVWPAAGGRPTPVPVPPAAASEYAGHHVLFSPDGQWLLTPGPGGVGRWRVGTWEAGPSVAGHWPLAFTRPGPAPALMALGADRTTVRLLDPASDREFATLASPDARPLWCLALSEDGARLAVGVRDHTVRVWDLRRLRSELQALGLDWDLPAYPAAGPPAVGVRVLPSDSPADRPADAARFEAEYLPVSRGEYGQGGGPYLDDKTSHLWSGGHLLRTMVGDLSSARSLTVDVDLPRAARYRVLVRHARGPEYGQVVVEIDGRPIGRLDGRHDRLALSDPIDLAVADLAEGKHRLTFGTPTPNVNPAMIGLDTLEFRPEPPGR